MQSIVKGVASHAFKCIFVLLLVAGVVYEQAGRRRDRARLPQIGTSVDIGGRSLNIYCSGEGSPAVILDTGAAEPGYAWSHIQPAIARYTRACWFDRAGEGWSDQGPFPRTSGATARDLHELLRRAGVPPPFVLVGHSLGGLDARVFNGLYGHDVAGMVLVDSAHEEEPRRAPAFMLGHTAPHYLWYPLYLVTQAALRVGLIRFITPSAPRVQHPGEPTREELVDALRRLPRAVATRAGDATAPESYAQAHAAGSLGDRPLIVLTAGKPPSPSGDPEIDRQAAEYRRIWMHELQPQLARLSSRGRQIILYTSGHRIPDEAPGAVLDAVREVVAEVRDTRR